jgi:hypothetical protein
MRLCRIARPSRTCPSNAPHLGRSRTIDSPAFAEDACKRRRTGIEIVVSVAVARSIGITVAAGTIVLEKFHSGHQVFFRGRNGVSKMRCMPRRRRIEGEMGEGLFQPRRSGIRVCR